MHVIRVRARVPTRRFFGRAMTAGDLYTVAGALPVATAGGRRTTAPGGCCTQLGTPVGVAVSATRGAVLRRRQRRHGRVSSLRGGPREPIRPPDLPRFLRRRWLPWRRGAGGRIAARIRADAADAADRGARRRRGRRARSTARRRAHGQRPEDPVGIDPDECSFAWTLQAHGPGRRADGLPHSGAAHRPRPRRLGLGQRPGAVRPAGLRRLRRARARRRRRLPVDRPVPEARRAWGPVVGAGPLHHRAAGGGLEAQLAAPGRELAAARPGDLSPDRGDAARRHASRVPPPTSRRPTPTACTWTARRWTPGRASRIPTSSTSRAVDLTGALAGDGPAPSACCTAGTGRDRAGRPPPPACSCSSPSGTPTAARRLRVRRRRGASTRPSGCRRHSATPTWATSWSGWTGGPTRRAGRARASTTARGRRPR